MKKIKTIICILLIVAGFIFNGEMYIVYLDNFQESNYQSRYNFTNIPETDNEIINDFVVSGNKHNVDFYMIHEELLSAYDKQLTIFGTKKAIQYLKAKGISEKQYSSLFLGSTSVKFESFKNISNLSAYNNCYYIGGQAKQADLHAFKAELVNQYAGGFPKLQGSDKETWLNLLAVWLVIFGLIIILTAYEIQFQKKETTIRFVLGEDPWHIFFKNAAADMTMLLSIFILAPAFLHGLSNVYFKYPFLCLMFILLIIFDISINGLILRIDFKRDFANHNHSKYSIVANYGLKILSATFCIIVLSSNLFVFSEGYDLYTQKDFFKTHNGYNYYQLSYRVDNEIGKTMEDDDEMNKAFILRFKEYSLQYVDLSDNFNRVYPVILINQNTMRELGDQWPSLAKKLSMLSGGKFTYYTPQILIRPQKSFNLAKRSIAFFLEDQCLQHRNH